MTTLLDRPPSQEVIGPGPEAPAPARPPRFPAFDGLRAIAALTVLGVHTAFSSGLTLRSGVGIYTARLEIGVAVFFLISGFLLYRPFVVAHLAAARPPRTGAFWIRRLLRIIPLYWFVLFVSTSLLHADRGIGPGGWKGYLVHYFFGQIYWPNQAFYGLSQAWSLCVEMTFYFALPFYALLIGWRRQRRSDLGRLVAELCGIVALCAIDVGWNFYVLARQRHHSDLFHVATTWLPAYTGLFALGMLLATLSAWSHHHGREHGWLSSWWFPWASWVVAGFCFWGVCHLGLPVLPLYTPSQLDIARQTLYGAFAFFLLLPAVFGPSRKGLIRKFLCWWPMFALGVISYGIYLWHETWIYQVLDVGKLHLFDIEFWAYFMAVLGLTVVASTGTYFVIEKPALRLKNSLTWWRTNVRRRPDAEVAAPPPVSRPTSPNQLPEAPQGRVGQRQNGQPDRGEGTLTPTSAGEQPRAP